MIDPFPLTQCKTMSTLDFEHLRGRHVIEPKIDGWRMQIEVRPDEVNAWTRTQKSATGKMPTVERHLQHIAGRHRFILDGEAVFVDEDSRPDYNLTQRCLGSGVDVCVMKQEELGRSLTYFVFDMLMLDDHDIRHLSLERRKQLMRRYLATTGSVDVVLGDEPSYAQHAFNFETFLEGSVIKDLASPYAGKRHKSWLKLKEMETADVKIIEDPKLGQGKYIGLVGAIHFRAADGTEGYCSGMTDEERVWITDHYVGLVGSTMEIRHFGKLVDGYRHPQFRRLRLDK